MKKIVNIKTIFDFFIFLNLVILCCDADNSVLFYISLIGLILSVLLRGKIEKKIIFSDMNVWNYMFLSFSIFSIIWSIDKSESTQMTLLLIRRFAIIFVISVFVRSYKDMEKILKFYLIANFLMMLKISFFIFKGYSGVRMWDEICGNYFNTVAQFLAIGIVIAYYFFKKYKKNNLLKILCISFIAFAFYHIYLTGSRKGLIMPVIEIFIFRIFESNLSLKKIMSDFAIICIGVLIIIFFLAQNPEILDRFNIIINMFFTGETADESTYLRQYYITLAGEMFFKSPIIGNGVNSFAYVLETITGVYKYSHNNFMEILSGTGLIGFVLYYWFYVKLGIKLFSKRYNNLINILGLSILITITFFEYGIVTYSIYMYPIIISIFSIDFKDKIKEKERNKI